MFNSTNFNTSFPSFYEDNNNNNNTPLLSHPSDEINPNYHYDPIYSPLFYYDIENYVELLNNNSHDLTIIQEPLQATNSSVITDDSSILEVNTNTMDSNKGDEVSGITVNRQSSSISGLKRRRTSNKDRHSKIKTAQGLRDRRMRLSLEVARQFFELQDMLGYDKASRTVEWLLNQSKLAIDEVIASKIGSPSGVTKCTISSTSDCEVESVVVDKKNGNNDNNNNNNKGKKSMVNIAKDGKNKERRLRTTKEAMKKARDKARQRTLEKMQSRGIIKEQNDAKSHPLAIGGCEVIEGDNNANSRNLKSGHSLGGGGDFVDVSLMQNWNSSTNFTY